MVVKTNYGYVSGIRTKDCVIYKGIPYAKPPVGSLRWRAPQKPECWDGIYSAKCFKDRCVQIDMDNSNPITAMFVKEFYSNPEFMPEMSEDCLYLNIWAPNELPKEKLPVAFWIHGGAFKTGFGSELEFDGAEYVKKGIILVTINYRLNVFGFLSHPWLDEENDLHVSGNYGTLDQIAALQWVYENIENFGGDPARITVFGQSAGSMSTQVLISSELTGNMISKAIMQSGLAYDAPLFPTPTMQEVQEYGKRFVEIAGAKNLDELRLMPATQLEECMRLLDEQLAKEGVVLSMVPNVDGYVLKDSVKDAVFKGTIKKIPYMIGTVGNEIGDFEEYIKTHGHGMLYEDCNAWSLEAEKQMDNPAYIYYFNRQLPGDMFGPFHTSELWYTFGTLDRCWRPWEARDYELSREMIACWTNFIKMGQPDAAGAWKKYTDALKVIKVFE